MDNKPETLLVALEQRKSMIREKTLQLIADGKSPYSEIAENLGITDPAEKAIVFELAAVEQKSNIITLSGKRQTEELIQINAVRSVLRGILNKIQKGHYADEVAVIAGVDYAKAMERQAAR